MDGSDNSPVLPFTNTCLTKKKSTLRYYSKTNSVLKTTDTFVITCCNLNGTVMLEDSLPPPDPRQTTRRNWSLPIHRKQMKFHIGL